MDSHSPDCLAQNAACLCRAHAGCDAPVGLDGKCPTHGYVLNRRTLAQANSRTRHVALVEFRRERAALKNGPTLTDLCASTGHRHMRQRPWSCDCMWGCDSCGIRYECECGAYLRHAPAL